MILLPHSLQYIGRRKAKQCFIDCGVKSKMTTHQPLQAQDRRLQLHLLGLKSILVYMLPSNSVGVSGLKQSRVQSLCLSSHCAMGAVHKAAASSGTALRQSMQGHQNNVFPPQVCLENNFKKKRRKKGPPQTLFNQNFILRSLTQARSALSRSSISTICCVCLYLEQVFTDYHGKENLP